MLNKEGEYRISNIEQGMTIVEVVALRGERVGNLLSELFNSLIL